MFVKRMIMDNVTLRQWCAAGEDFPTVWGKCPEGTKGDGPLGAPTNAAGGGVLQVPFAPRGGMLPFPGALFLLMPAGKKPKRGLKSAGDYGMLIPLRKTEYL